ncbi:hypothetical protein APTSU1_001858200 [Apodemus speciosus]|uniref:Uncharacterized protein n=1 Tax=Apodemus speciosus TaxID=105296 RepID=A0ABQ0FW24_APOSI
MQGINTKLNEFKSCDQAYSLVLKEWLHYGKIPSR